MTNPILLHLAAEVRTGAGAITISSSDDDGDEDSERSSLPIVPEPAENADGASTSHGSNISVFPHR